MYKKQRTMKIYKYKVAMMVAAAWFIATALFCTIPSVWRALKNYRYFGSPDKPGGLGI